MKLILLCGFILWMFTSCDDNTSINSNPVNNNNYSTSCSGPIDTTYCSGQAIVLCGLGENGYQEYSFEFCDETPNSFCYDTNSDPYCVNPGTEPCDTEDEYRCIGSLIQRCKDDYSGNLMWADIEDCGFYRNTCNITDQRADCVECNFPAPLNPIPSSGATDIDPEEINTLSWSPSDGADFYYIYLGQCPPPEYPYDYFIEVASTIFFADLEYNILYCWQVIAIYSNGCKVPGELWNFRTKRQ